MNSYFRFLSALFLALVILASVQTHADEFSPDHTLREVAVYPNSAILTRDVEVNLPAGRHTVFFDDIPTGFTAQSLQVSAEGSSVLRIYGSEVKKRTLQTALGKERQQLEEKIKSVRYELDTLRTEQQQLEVEKKRLEAIGLDRTNTAEVPGRSVQEMQKLLQFTSDAISKRNTRLLALLREISHSQEKLRTLEAELQALGPATRTVTSIAADVGCESPFRGTLTLRYETNPGRVRWRPTYRVRVQIEDGDPKISLETSALLQQFTGEDWEGVKLSISTVQPQRGLKRPQVYPQYLDVQRPVARSRGLMKNFAVGASMMEADLASAPMPQDAEDRIQSEEGKIREKSETVYASLRDAGLLEFAVPHLVTVESQGAENRIPLSEENLKGELRYIAVPSQLQKVFREIEVQNTLAFPLLAGEMDVFINGVYFGKERKDQVLPKERFTLALGEASEVKVSRELKNTFEDDTGIVRSFRRIQKTFAVTVENLTKKAVDVVLLEPTPVSRNEKITATVKDVTPKSVPLEEDSRVDNREGVLEWHLKIPPEKEKTISYATSIEFKSDLPVTGL
jgi:uncharacterized protein (TIGR02231 family)